MFLVAIYTTDYIAKAYGIKATRNEATAHPCAADVVSRAFDERGIECGAPKIMDWINNGKHQANRLRVDAVLHSYFEIALNELGVVRSRAQWHVGPFGPSGIKPIIGRMT